MDYVFECQSEVAKVGSTASVRNSVLIISHVAFRDCRVHFFPKTFLEIAVCTTLMDLPDLASDGSPLFAEPMFLFG